MQALVFAEGKVCDKNFLCDTPAPLCPSQSPLKATKYNRSCLCTIQFCGNLSNKWHGNCPLAIFRTAHARTVNVPTCTEGETRMAYRIGINGFGRMVLRATLTRPDVEVVAINDLANIGDLTYLLKYDSVHGLFPGGVAHDDTTIMLNGTRVQYAEREPAKIPWGRAGVDVVIEATGALRGRQDACGHLQGGARKVLISAPSDNVDVTIVPGVNDAAYSPRQHHVLSMASCTTNSLAPVAKVLQDQFGIVRLMITTVHAYTASQSIMDKPTRKRRQGRAGALSMIPTSTGAAQATGLVLPELA